MSSILDRKIQHLIYFKTYMKNKVKQVDIDTEFIKNKSISKISSLGRSFTSNE